MEIVEGFRASKVPSCSYTSHHVLTHTPVPETQEIPVVELHRGLHRPWETVVIPIQGFPEHLLVGVGVGDDAGLRPPVLERPEEVEREADSRNAFLAAFKNDEMTDTSLKTLSDFLDEMTLTTIWDQRNDPLLFRVDQEVLTKLGELIFPTHEMRRPIAETYIELAAPAAVPAMTRMRSLVAMV